MLGTTRSPHRSRPLGTATSAVYQTGTQFQARFNATVAAGTPVPRGSLPGEAELLAHTVAAVSSTPSSMIVEITDKWRIQYPMSIETFGAKVRHIYALWAGPITITPLYGARPIAADAAPPGPSVDPGRDVSTGSASDLARRVVDNLEAMGSRYDHALVAQFQRAAGITADGVYGPQTRTHILRYVSSAPGVEEVRASPGGGGGGRTTPRDALTPGGGTPAPQSSSAGWYIAVGALAVLAIGAFVVTR